MLPARYNIPYACLLRCALYFLTAFEKHAILPQVPHFAFAAEACEPRNGVGILRRRKAVPSENNAINYGPRAVAATSDLSAPSGPTLSVWPGLGSGSQFLAFWFDPGGCRGQQARDSFISHFVDPVSV